MTNIDYLSHNVKCLHRAMSSRKRYIVVISVVLCMAAFAGYLYLNSHPQRDVLPLANHLEDSAPSLTVDDSTYGVNIEPGQAFVLTDEFDGQQGAGLESLVSLQVSS